METLWYTAVRVNENSEKAITEKIANAYKALYERGYSAAWDTVDGFTMFYVSYYSSEFDDVCAVLQGVINPITRTSIIGSAATVGGVEFLDYSRLH